MVTVQLRRSNGLGPEPVERREKGRGRGARLGLLRDCSKYREGEPCLLVESVPRLEESRL